MPSLWYWDSTDYQMLERCRREVKAQMIASGFQIGGKFDTVLHKRTWKLYGRNRQ